MTEIRPVEWRDGRVRFLDQTLLPERETYVDAADEHVLADAIRRLAIRGAPLIGVAVAYGVALAAARAAESGVADARSRIASAIDLLAATRPTAVNLFWALERQRQVLRRMSDAALPALAEALLSEARAVHSEDADRCDRMAATGASLLKTGSAVLTHCNSGALATGGRGTALGVIVRAWEDGAVRHVYVDETRPLLQGARLTAWELEQRKVPYTVITDSTAGMLMAQGRVQAVLVGADRIAANGDVANKVGTYALAVLAHHHRMPFLVVAPTSTIDMECPNGGAVPIEERNAAEVTQIGGTRLTPQGATAYAPAFDVTPHDLITVIVTDAGAAFPPFGDSIRSMTDHAKG